MVGYRDIVVCLPSILIESLYQCPHLYMRNQHYVCLHLNYSYINLFIRNELNEKISILILLISVIIILFIYISHEIKREHYIKVQKARIELFLNII